MAISKRSKRSSTRCASQTVIPKRKRSFRSRPRNWGTMSPSILACILQNLAITDLLLSVPHVCRGRRVAASRTKFFVSEGTQLNLRCVDALCGRETAIYLNLLRLSITITQPTLDRLQFCQDVILPEDLVLFIAQRSTCLKNLTLPEISIDHFSPSLLAKTLRYWTNLTSFEAVTLRTTGVTCIRLVADHCYKLTHLGIHGVVDKHMAEAILTCLPGIQSLDFRSSFFSEIALDMILDGVRNLKNISLMHAICGDEEDMMRFVIKVLKERRAMELKPEALGKLAAVENFTYCGGKTCACCSWFYKVDHFDLYDFLKLI